MQFLSLSEQLTRISQCLFFIDLQKQGCCELVFGLMVNPKPSKLPQDQVQMTLRSEVLLNEIKNEFRRCKQKEDLRIGA